MAEVSKRYQVIRTSSIKSALGETRANPKDLVVFEFKNKEAAEAKAEALNKTVLPEEKDFLGTEYSVKEV